MIESLLFALGAVYLASLFVFLIALWELKRKKKTHSAAK